MGIAVGVAVGVAVGIAVGVAVGAAVVYVGSAVAVTLKTPLVHTEPRE